MTMARHYIDPQAVRRFRLAEPQRAEILATLPCMQGEIAEFVAALERYASDYQWINKQYHGRRSQAEQNALANDINQVAILLASRLRCIDMEVKWNIMSFAALPPGFLQDLIEHLETIADAAERTLRRGKHKTGPRRNPAIDRVMPQLSALYERYTGQTFTHNPKQKTEYLGRPQSAAGRFVIAFFRAVDLSISETAICTAMAIVQRSKQRLGRQSNPSRAT